MYSPVNSIHLFKRLISRPVAWRPAPQRKSLTGAFSYGDFQKNAPDGALFVLRHPFLACAPWKPPYRNPHRNGPIDQFETNNGYSFFLVSNTSGTFKISEGNRLIYMRLRVLVLRAFKSGGEKERNKALQTVLRSGGYAGFFWMCFNGISYRFVIVNTYRK